MFPGEQVLVAVTLGLQPGLSSPQDKLFLIPDHRSFGGGVKLCRSHTQERLWVDERRLPDNQRGAIIIVVIPANEKMV